MDFISGVIPPDSHAPAALPPPAPVDFGNGKGHRKAGGTFGKIGRGLRRLFGRKRKRR